MKEIYEKTALKKQEEIVAEIERKGLPEIKSNDDYSTAGEYLAFVKDKKTEILNIRLSLTRPLEESKKRILNLFEKPIAFLDDVISKLNSRMTTYHTKQIEAEQKEKHQAELAKEQAAITARQKQLDIESQAAVAKQKALDAELAIQKAEKSRLEAIRANDEKARMAAEQARTNLERDKQKAENELANKQKLASNAAAHVTEILETPIITKHTEPNSKSITQRATWKYEIINKSLIPNEYLLPDLGKIDAHAKKNHGEPPVPGIRFYIQVDSVLKGTRDKP